MLFEETPLSHELHIAAQIHKLVLKAYPKSGALKSMTSR